MSTHCVALTFRAGRQRRGVSNGFRLALLYASDERGREDGVLFDGNFAPATYAAVYARKRSDLVRFKLVAKGRVFDAEEMGTVTVSGRDKQASVTGR